MEAKNFFNCNISPVVSKIFACKWSEDNRLSLVTEKGVHIVEVIPAPMQTNPILKLSRTFIYAPETLPCEIYVNEVLSKIFDWDKEDVYSFLMQDSCTPNFPNALKMTPEIIDVSWSPQKLLYPDKCLLAIITSSGAVELAIQVDRNWISIYEFTTKWAQIINTELKSEKNNVELNAQSLKMKLNRLIATTITWSHIYQENNNNFAYLVISHRNSEIVIWKIHRLINIISNIDVNINVELKFKKQLPNENIKINTMLWVQLDEKNYLLLIGFFNGQIGTLKLQEFEGAIIYQSYSVSYPDIDNISVEMLYVLQQTDKWLEIMVVKGMFLLILTLDVDGKIIYTKFISSPGFSITGTSVINPDKILISTQDGSLNLVQKSENQQELSCIPVKIDVLKKYVQYLGLTNSHNKLLFTLITSPSIMYDHLIDRDPSCIWFFSLSNVTLDPLDIIYQENSLLKCWDCLELIKINGLKYSDISQTLSKLDLNFESQSIHKLRVAYWIMIITKNLKKKNLAENVSDPSETIEQTKTYIFLHSASNYLIQLSLRKNLSEIQKLSINLLKYNLEIWLAGEEEEDETLLSKRVKQILETVNEFDLDEQEKCNYCNEVIVEPWASSCPTGHILPRCALTCLQVTCVKFRTCVVCKEIFHPSLDEEFKNLVKCLYCDLPAIYTNQLPYLTTYTSEKNLSKKRENVNTKDSNDD